MENQAQKIKEAIAKLKSDSRKENLDNLMNLLEKEIVFVPASLPPMTDPSIIKKLASMKAAPIPEGVSPNLAVLNNKNGKNFLPIFTSQKKAESHSEGYPLVLSVPFRQCMDFAAKQLNVEGVVVNPFEDNVTLNINRSSEQKNPEYSEAQFHFVVRHKIEAETLPKLFFAQKGEFINTIKKEEGGYLLQLFQKLYPEQIACPYEAKDFDVMMLTLKEDLKVMRIILPLEKAYPGTCTMLLISWNEKLSKLRYFAIVRAAQNEENQIMEFHENGDLENCGKAPSEGSEFQYMMEIS